MGKVEPVAWRCNWGASDDGISWIQYHDETDPLPPHEAWESAPDEILPLYPQSAIDSLQVMLDDAHADFKEMERLAHMHKARAERAEAEVEALRELVAYVRETAHHNAPAAAAARAALRDHDQEGKDG